MSLPKDVLNSLNDINVDRHPVTLDAHPKVLLHEIYWGDGRRKVSVQSPLLTCHGVFKTQDGKINMHADVGKGDWRRVLAAVDDLIVSNIAEVYGMGDAEVAKLRYLSSVRTADTRQRIKIRVPMRDDVPDVKTYDGSFNPISSAIILNDDFKSARVAVVVETDAAWVLQNGAWFGCNWVLRQLLVKQDGAEKHEAPCDWALTAETEQKE